ncbi:MAG: hypothetical protein BAJALOKI2v1_910007 [Promethearchaeota archaeon]|nr:MAG: hypothetical protein BAJALOKI2v1_910007 [Candidatus Lokiarchaeota archaeon]
MYKGLLAEKISYSSNNEDLFKVKKMSQLSIRLNPTSFGYYCGSFCCCIVFGSVPIIFSPYLRSVFPISSLYYFLIVGAAILIGIYMFFYGIFRAKPTHIILKPSELRVTYKNREPIVIPKREMRKVKIKYRYYSDSPSTYYLKVKRKGKKTKRILIRDTPRRKEYRKYRKIKKYSKRHYPH